MTTDRSSESPRGMSGALPSSMEADLAALAPLAEPLRRRLYLFVAGSPDAVGRDEAAQELGISRSLAAFHLDRLVDEGLLRPEYRRLSGRTGPGAGRPAKLYRRATETRAVSLPPATTSSPRASSPTPWRIPTRPADRRGVRREAFAYGRGVGRAAAPDAPATTAAALTSALAEQGFEPRTTDGVIRLGNCPFHALAAGPARPDVRHEPRADVGPARRARRAGLAGDPRSATRVVLRRVCAIRGPGVGHACDVRTV